MTAPMGGDLEAAAIGAGLLDPDDELAPRRLEAFALLVAHGATLDDLVEHQGDLGLLASRLVNGGLLTMSRRDLAERAGVSLDLVQRLSLATGLPDPGPDAPSGNDADLAMLETFLAGGEVFGDDVALQLGRVIGSATARIADALVSAFITVIGPQAGEDPSGLEIVRANLALSELMPDLMAAVEQLLRRHLVNLSRPLALSPSAGYETRQLTIGFVDLVGSTALAGRLTTAELSAALGEFEATAADIVVSHRGRVVKLIGDEVMFMTTQPADSLAIANELIAAFAHHAALPPVRVGLGHGEVLTRDGDCFGPVVNLAARVVTVAGASELVIEEALHDRIDSHSWAVEALGEQRLKGIDDPVPLLRLTRRD